MMVDPDGRDGMITGQGTKDDPYVVTAVYYYQTGSLNKDQVKGLNAAIADYRLKRQHLNDINSLI